MKKRHAYARRFLLAGLILCTVWVQAGDLNPPTGPITPTMKTLDQIEPRIPISSIPFPINAPGSYYVTRDLVGTTGQHGITITAPQVTVDLNGFTLRGVPGSLNGINVATAVEGIDIHNGNLIGWGQNGIVMAAGSKCKTSKCNGSGCGVSGIVVASGSSVASCTANDNGGKGVATGDSCSVTDCSCSGNGDDGVSTGAGCNVKCCECNNNGGDGVATGNDCNVTDCKCNGNGSDGCSTGSGCTITQVTANNNVAGNGIVSVGTDGCTYHTCTAAGNGANGISASAGSTITACTASNNTADGILTSFGCTVSNCTARTNTGDGIEVSTDCYVRDNACDGNGLGAGDGAGIHVIGTGNDTRIENNNVTDNDRGIDVDSAAGNLIIRNSASGNTANYDIVAGNTVGAILIVGGNGAFSSTNSWANLDF